MEVLDTGTAELIAAVFADTADVDNVISDIAGASSDVDDGAASDFNDGASHDLT